MKKNLTIVVPVYNEDNKIVDSLINQLNQLAIPSMVIDDGSLYPVCDGMWGSTPKGIKKSQEGHCTIIRFNKNKGYGSAIKYALRHTKSKYIGIIDADGQYDLTDLEAMWQSLDREDMVIGRRITHQGGWKRFWGRLFIKTVASIACSRYIPDLNSGIRIFKRHIAKSYASILCDEFSFTTSLTMAMILDGYKVRWVDANFYPRQGSFSNVREVRHGLITLYQIAKITIGLRTRNLRSKLRGENIIDTPSR